MTLFAEVRNCSSAKAPLVLFHGFGAQNSAFFFTFGNQNGTAFFALGTQNALAALTLCFHLFFHRVLNFCGRNDVFHFYAVYLDAPFVGGFV